MSKPTATLVYKQTIMPVLEYCGYLFNGITHAQHKRLQHVQNRCLRTSLNVKLRYHVSDLHKDAEIDYLSTRYDLQLVMLVYKYLHSETHDSSALGLVLQQPAPCGRVMRSTGTGLLEWPNSKLLGYRKSPLYRGISLWNSLSIECRRAETKETFKDLATPIIRTLNIEKLKARGLIS